MPCLQFATRATSLTQDSILKNRSIESQGQTIASRSQIPLRLAYAITIHKCQGMTLSRAFIQFSDIFEDNQAYVMLSRVRTAAGTTIGHLRKKVVTTHEQALKFTQDLMRNSTHIRSAVENATSGSGATV